MQFAYSADRVGVVVEAGAEKRFEYLSGGRGADDPRTHGQSVGVVVLHTLMRGVDVVGECAADAGDFVGRHDGALAGSADEYRAVGFTSQYGSARVQGDVREIHGLFALRAGVDDLMAELLEYRAHMRLE